MSSIWHGENVTTQKTREIYADGDKSVCCLKKKKKKGNSGNGLVTGSAE